MIKKTKRLELIGLAILLIASMWQLFFVSFFEKNFIDEQHYIEEDIYYDLLKSQEDIAQIMVIEDIDERYKKMNEISARNGNRRTETITARQNKFKTWRDDAEIFQNIRILLFLLGSLLLLLGKFLEIQFLSDGCILSPNRENGKISPIKEATEDNLESKEKMVTRCTMHTFGTRTIHRPLISMNKNDKKYKIATAIWILSCTDKTPQMTYRALAERVEDTDENELRKFIKLFPELYMDKIQLAQLKMWKSEMLNENSRPKWIASSLNQEEVINLLSVEDLFRNRFRNGLKAPTASPEILKWGLDYLKQYYSIKEVRKNKLMERLGTIGIPILSLLIAGLSLIYSNSINKRQIDFESDRATRDVIVPSYHRFLSGVHNSLNGLGDITKLEESSKDIMKSRLALYELAPFIGDTLLVESIQNLSSYQVTLIETMRLEIDSISEKQINEVVTKSQEVQFPILKAMNNFLKINEKDQDQD